VAQEVKMGSASHSGVPSDANPNALTSEEAKLGL